MNARDELAEVIYKARWVDAVENAEMATDAKMAETILAAGWVKPRTITTVEELDALPDYSAVMLAGRDGLICQKRYGSWALMGFDERVSLPQIAGDLPATVLHEGQA